MKKLFAVLLAVAMLLSLSVVTFASTLNDEEVAAANANTGVISIVNASAYSYKIYKVFSASVAADGKVSYQNNTGFATAITSAIDANNDNVKFYIDDAGNIVADAGYSAADFAAWLKTNIGSNSPIATIAADSDPMSATALDPGYYLIVPYSGETAGELAALATVIGGRTTQVQNKNDMPLDKEVDNADEDANYDDNGEGVNVGDILNYKITGKLPAEVPDPAENAATASDYVWIVTDKMSEGLTFGDVLTIKIGNNTITVTKVDGKWTASGNTADIGGFEVVPTASDMPLTGNQIRFGHADKENGGNFTFELSLDVDNEQLRAMPGANVEITYTGQVNGSAVVELLQNTAVLAYGNEDNLNYKDAETDNYISRIVIDKFETGNRTQKLPGAEFVLYKNVTTTTTVNGEATTTTTKKYYKLNEAQAATPAIYYTQDEVDNWDPAAHNGEAAPTTETVKVPAVPATPITVTWEDSIDDATHVTTDANGFAEFPYLEDGTYYLVETRAPIDYTLMQGYIEIVVNGSAAADTRLTYQQRVDALTNTVNVANKPGTSMPSTGGVGATLLTIGGVVLMLAAGAYLILRRKEQE